jgi:3-hydroxyacyl-CoA dehydrogenase/enoyl-CoA hydratase/3-hydroxybutyryl-CoA epimerase/enoyl-CoA isomerase
MSKVGKGYITTDEAMDIMSKLQSVSHESEMSGCDLVIEAVDESYDAKLAVFDKLIMDGGMPGVLATNTSSLSVDKLAEEVNPKTFCGIHFFNPVNKMPLVEIVRGKNTSDETIARAINFANSLGKTPVVVKDCNGFLVNRLLFPYLVAFDNLVAEGVDFQQIDKVMENWGWPMGPATLSDLVGIQIVYKAAAVMKSAYPDRVKFDIANGPTAQLYSAGSMGQKSGKGWYNWTNKNGTYKKGAANWKSGKDIKDSEIISKLMSPMIAEAKIILEEGIVPSWNEINVAMIYGAGFPPFRGGLDKV